VLFGEGNKHISWNIHNTKGEDNRSQASPYPSWTEMTQRETTLNCHISFLFATALCRGSYSEIYHFPGAPDKAERDLKLSALSVPCFHVMLSCHALVPCFQCHAHMDQRIVFFIYPWRLQNSVSRLLALMPMRYEDKTRHIPVPQSEMNCSSSERYT
jgi:hypothetical protein